MAHSQRLQSLIDFIRRAINYIKNIVKKIITGLFNFVAHCVNWFKSLSLNKNKDIPFIANPEQFKEMLRNAPVKKVGIFEGVFDKELNEITFNQNIEADGLDNATRETLGQEAIVVLN